MNAHELNAAIAAAGYACPNLFARYEQFDITLNNKTIARIQPLFGSPFAVQLRCYHFKPRSRFTLGYRHQEPSNPRFWGKRRFTKLLAVMENLGRASVGGPTPLDEKRGKLEAHVEALGTHLDDIRRTTQCVSTELLRYFLIVTSDLPPADSSLAQQVDDLRKSFDAYDKARGAYHKARAELALLDESA